MGRKEILMFVWCHFCLVRTIIEKTSPLLTRPHHIPSTIISLLLTTLFLLTLIPLTFLLLKTYKLLTTLLLNLIHGHTFHGLITGCNLLTLLRNKNGFPIHGIVLAETNDDDFFERLKKGVWERLRGLEGRGRFFSVRERFMGFEYWREVEDLRFDEVFVEVDVEGDVEDFLRVCAEVPMPRGDKFSWDLLYRPLAVSSNENLKRKVCFVLRVHHSVVDGFSLYNLIKSVFSRTSGEGERRRLNLTNPKTSVFKLPKRFNPRTSQEAWNLGGKGEVGSSQKVSFLVEDCGDFVGKVGEIKRKLGGFSFNSIVFGVYSAALGEFYRKRGEISPELLTVSLPAQMGFERILNLNSDKFCGAGNDYAFFDVTLPVVPKGKEQQSIESYIFERLELVNEEFNNVNKYIDLQFNYMFMKSYLELLPGSIAFRISQSGNYGVIGSCFPGGPTLELFTGDRMSDFCFFLPVLATKCGLGIFVTTYGGRFQLAQVADVSRFGNDADGLDEILKDFFKFLDILHKRCC